jgi:signal transduction histidine kinase
MIFNRIHSRHRRYIRYTRNQLQYGERDIVKAQRMVTILFIVACVVMFYSLPSFTFDLHNINDWLTFVMLGGVLYIVQRYPMPISSGVASLDFPILYFLIMVYGYVEAILILIIVVLIKDVKSRPSRVYIFNLSNHIISLWLALQCTSFFITMNPIYFNERITHLCIFLGVYTLINNALVDIILWLRKQPYTAKHWLQKTKLIAVVTTLSFGYTFLFHLFSYQQRSGDFFSITFFFLPLVAGSIISYIIAELAQEKQKLEALFYASKKMNESIELEAVVDGIEEAIGDVVSYDFGIIYFIEQKIVVPKKVFGYQVEESEAYYLNLGHMITSLVIESKEAHLIPNLSSKLGKTRYKNNGNGMDTLLAVPLLLENEVAGVIVLGKERSYSYFDPDKTILQTLANQAATALKNCQLIRESEKKIIVEERNRLAREIHDGIAQSIAAIAMQVDSSIRFFDQNPTQVKGWLEECLHGLRSSLKEIRQSIYSLRPNPVEKIGLHKALHQKIEEFQTSTGIPCNFQVKGPPVTLGSKLEVTLYQVVAEALQNCYKHANAKRVDVFINYSAKQVELFVRDDGEGFLLNEVLTRNKHEKHFGILNMNDLVTKMDGSFQINSGKENGTEIKVSINLKNS